jgi:hypothetical protein
MSMREPLTMRTHSLLLDRLYPYVNLSTENFESSYLRPLHVDLRFDPTVECVDFVNEYRPFRPPSMTQWVTN